MPAVRRGDEGRRVDSRVRVESDRRGRVETARGIQDEFCKNGRLFFFFDSSYKLEIGVRSEVYKNGHSCYQSGPYILIFNKKNETIFL